MVPPQTLCLTVRPWLRPVLRPVLWPVLRPAAKYAAGRSTQTAAREIAFILPRSLQVKFHCAISGNAEMQEKVAICTTRCGPLPAAKY